MRKCQRNWKNAKEQNFSFSQFALTQFGAIVQWYDKWHYMKKINLLSSKRESNLQLSRDLSLFTAKDL